jgi:hypothetical protein
VTNLSFHDGKHLIRDLELAGLVVPSPLDVPGRHQATDEVGENRCHPPILLHLRPPGFHLWGVLVGVVGDTNLLVVPVDRCRGLPDHQVEDVDTLGVLSLGGHHGLLSPQFSISENGGLVDDLRVHGLAPARVDDSGEVEGDRVDTFIVCEVADSVDLQCHVEGCLVAQRSGEIGSRRVDRRPDVSEPSEDG